LSAHKQKAYPQKYQKVLAEGARQHSLWSNPGSPTLCPSCLINRHRGKTGANFARQQTPSYHLALVCIASLGSGRCRTYIVRLPLEVQQSLAAALCTLQPTDLDHAGAIMFSRHGRNAYVVFEGPQSAVQQAYKSRPQAADIQCQGAPHLGHTVGLHTHSNLTFTAAQSPLFK
jgi:hypothetical protein